MHLFPAGKSGTTGLSHLKAQESLHFHKNLDVPCLAIQHRWAKGKSQVLDANVLSAGQLRTDNPKVTQHFIKGFW